VDALNAIATLPLQTRVIKDEAFFTIDESGGTVLVLNSVWVIYMVGLNFRKLILVRRLESTQSPPLGKRGCVCYYLSIGTVLECP
jgi:hypothetical protein